MKRSSLKKDPEQNELTAEEISNIWIPWLVFHNIENYKSYEKTDEIDMYKVIPNQEFHFVTADKTNLLNKRIFDGSRNKIRYSRQITVNWMCNYDMRWYPFDQQNCEMVFFSQEPILLVPLKTEYMGPKVLPQHFVKSVTVVNSTVKGRPAINVVLQFRRPLFGFIISLAMPTVIMVLLSQMVNVYRADNIDLVIGVNVTLMLVLATL